MRRRLVRTGPLVALVAATMSAAGCGGQVPPSSLDSWSEGRSSMTGGSRDHVPRLPDTAEPVQESLLTDPREGLPLPSVWRVIIDGTVLDDEGGHLVDQVGWLLLAQPYDQQPSSDNDLNILDLGIRTDASPLDGFAGALWLGTNTEVAGDLGLPTYGAGLGDVVRQTRDGDTVSIEFIDTLMPVEGFDLYGIRGGLASQVVTGTMSLTFSADGSTITGAIDIGGAPGVGAPSAITEYRAAIQGTRQDG